MAEFSYVAEQLVTAGQNIILNTTIPCPRGYVLHRNESGIITLRGIVNNPQGCFARYQITFNGNIAAPAAEDGGVAGPISIAIAIDGEPLQSSQAIVTPTVVDSYFNVTSTAFITVPRGCCTTIAVENTSVSATPATTPAPPINVQNANLVITRVV